MEVEEDERIKEDRRKKMADLEKERVGCIHVHVQWNLCNRDRRK